MRRRLAASLLCAVLAACGPRPGGGPREVHHPRPRQPVYLDPAWYPTLRAQFPPPPAPGSRAQADDEAELRRLQNERGAEDCRQANLEVLVSLKSFFAAPHGPLDDATERELADFFEQVRNDADYFIQKLKLEYPRRRPFLYVAGLTPCVPREVTDAYPSGHGVLSRLFALILGELFPAQRERLEARVGAICDHRVLGGVHHRSDVRAGQDLGVLIYRQLQTSTRFQQDLEAARSRLSGEGRRGAPKGGLTTDRRRRRR
jgi:acid phosphatase (class A)